MFYIRIILLSLVFFLPFTCAFAQNHEQTAQEIYYETLSPFCPGRSLADCPTEQSRDVKAKILEDLKSGKNKQEVIQKFLSDYGQHLNSLPGFSGFNLIAWMLPLVIVIIGFIIVFKRTKLQNSEESE